MKARNEIRQSSPRQGRDARQMFITLRPAQWAAIDRLADEDNRSVANYVSALVSRHIGAGDSMEAHIDVDPTMLASALRNGQQARRDDA